MNNEYVIINKTQWLKKIEDLRKQRLLELKDDFYDTLYLGEVKAIKQILFQSTPLIPVVERAFDAGGAYTLGSHKEFTQTHPNRQDYISNLKLDI